jgi:flagellar hook-associated protein 2
MGYRLESFTDSVNGLLSAVDKSLTEQIRDFDSRIETLQSQISLREQSLRQKFAAMEQSIARLNSQGSQLSSFLRGQGS